MHIRAAIPETLDSRNLHQQPFPEVLADLHNEFERVHPFIDGNGRTGRLILNLVLVRLGYPPVIVLKNQREQYLAAMQKADAGDVGPLGEILARAMYDNLFTIGPGQWLDQLQGGARHLMQHPDLPR